MRQLLFLALFSLPLPLTAAGQADPLDHWPAWRGPLVSGAAPRADPPIKWDAKTNIRWKADLPGTGASTPIVWGDLVFVLSAEDTGKKADPKDIPKPHPDLEKKTEPPQTYHRFIVTALDRQSGKVRWQRIAAERVPHEGHHFSHSYAAGSPVTDGKKLYVSFGSFGAYCYDLQGNLLWKRDLGRLETRLGWGEAVTPALHGGRLFLTHDHEGPSFLTALDAETGKTLWKVDRDEVSSWATPLVVPHKGTTHVIVPGTKRMRSYDAATGKLLWQGPPMTVNCIPSPVARDGVAIVMSGYKGIAGAAISLDARGDVADQTLWRIDRGTPYVPSPLLVGDRLYFTQSFDPLLSCLDARTGKVLLDRVRLPGLRMLYGSPVAAAGRIYLADRDGTTLVFKHTDKLEILATNRLGEPIDASPAAVGKQLFLRSQKSVWCIEER